MKKTLSIIIIAMFFIQKASAQIIIYQADMPAIGDVIISGYDSSHVFVSPGNASANSQTWNFSTLQNIYSDTNIYTNPSWSSCGNSFTNANLAFTNSAGNNYQYFSSTATSFSMVGACNSSGAINSSIAIYPAYKQLALPATYNTTYLGTASVTQRYLNGVDSIKMVSINKYNSTIDAFGNVTTPVFFNVACLREKNTQIYSDSSYIKTGGVGNWVLNSSNCDTNYVYNWWSKQNKVPLVTIYNNTMGNRLGSQFLVSAPSPTAIKTENFSNIIVFPNPSSGAIFIKNIPQDIKQIVVFDAIGKVVFEVQSNSVFEEIKLVDKGIYLIQIIDNKGNTSSNKIVVE